MAKSLYLYRYLNNSNIEYKENINEEGLIISKKWPIIGVNQKNFRGKKLKELEKSLLLKEFEIEQRNFDMFIKMSNKSNVLLNDITFTEQISDDENRELKQYIKERKVSEILSFIEEQRYDMFRDIESLKFTMTINKINRITISSRGVISIDSNVEEEASILLSTDQFGIIIGIDINSLGFS